MLVTRAEVLVPIPLPLLGKEVRQRSKVTWENLELNEPCRKKLPAVDGNSRLKIVPKLAKFILE